MAKKEEKNKENKVKKHFFKDFKAELKKVIWPTPKQLVKNTVAVVTIVLITAVIVFALDTVFKAMNDNGITKLQNYVVEKFGENETVEESNDTETDETNSEESTDTEGTTSEETTDEGAATEGENNTTTEQQ